MVSVFDTIRGAAFAAALYLRIDGEPCSASRPRVTIKGTYYQKPYTMWRASALEQLQANCLAETISHPVIVAVEAVAKRPKATKFGAPRWDVDNVAKAAMDALTKAGVWVDDKLVRTLVVTKRWADIGESPGVHVWIEAH